MTGLCALALAVPAGRGADPPGRSGLAHLVEHLVLKPERLATEPFVLNAFTTGDLTVFETLCAASDVAAAENALLSVLDPLHVTPQALDLERRIIDVEAGGQDTPGSAIGLRAERAAITPDDVTTFHATHYRRASVALVDREGHLHQPDVSEGGLHDTPVVAGPGRVVVAGCGAPGYAGAAVAFGVVAGPGPQPFQVVNQVPHRFGQLRPGRSGSLLTVVEPSVRVEVERAREGLLAQLAMLREDPVLTARAEAAWAALRPGGLAGLADAIASVSVDAVREVVEVCTGDV